MLYLIATPIGNLSDLSPRAKETLNSCDYVLCEDTRRSRQLFHHFDIHSPLKSFHKFSESKQEDAVIHDLGQGKTIGLISDAGTPSISDPGEQLIARCNKENIQVCSIPGPCALIEALILSGFPTAPFQFVGFFPKKQGQLKRALVSWLQYEGSTVAYLSPHQTLKALAVFQLVAPTRRLMIARELTKKFEETLFGTAEEILEHFAKKPPKGEMALVIAPPNKEELYTELSPAEHIERVMERYDLPKKDAVKLVEKIRK